MRGMRSFGSVLTCSGWGFSHIGRFSPLGMMKRGEKTYFQHNKKGYRLMSDSLFTGISISLYKERWKRSAP